MKYYLVVGERSGDLHASNLMKSLLEEDKQAQFRFYGGDYMKEVGGELVQHYSTVSFMGVWEVVKNLRTIKGHIKKCQEDLYKYEPDTVILVDFSAFNLKIARYAKEKGIRVCYYISPKVWAWNTKRAYKVKKYVDHLFCILPFEKTFFKKYDYEVDYIGNPLLDALEAFTPNPDFSSVNGLSTAPIIAVLPGSRYQEVKAMLERMLEITSYYPDHQFVVAGVGNLNSQLYKNVESSQVKVVYNQTYDVLANAEMAIVTSGTATLETALFEVPQVVGYRTSFITALIAKLVLKIPYVSLVNLVAEKEIVKELLQYDFTASKLKKELNKIKVDGEKRAEVLKSYKEMKTKMGQAGVSKRTAQLIRKYVTSSNDTSY